MSWYKDLHPRTREVNTLRMSLLTKLGIYSILYVCCTVQFFLNFSKTSQWYRNRITGVLTHNQKKIFSYRWWDRLSASLIYEGTNCTFNPSHVHSKCGPGGTVQQPNMDRFESNESFLSPSHDSKDIDVNCHSFYFSCHSFQHLIRK